MGDLLGSLVRGSQKRTILYRLGWVVTNDIRGIASPEMGAAYASPEDHQWALAGMPRMGGIP
jgi:hypothetical protein